jgi:PAS domain S-box-containing protein
MDPRPTTPPSLATPEQLALLLDSIGDYAIFLLDPAGRISSWNLGARRLKGYEAGEILGEHFSRFYTPEDLARDHPAHELEIARAEGRYEEEGWRVRKDGSRFWASVLITALFVGGELMGYAKVTRDLTARRLAEEQLRARTAELIKANADLEQFRLMVSGVSDYAIFALDAGGHIRTWNEGARRIKGYEQEEVVGRHFAIFYTAEDRANDHPAHELDVAAREGRFEEEGWRLRKDGGRFWASVVITALRDRNHVLVGYAKVTRDLTERREADLALRHANEELERFASTAAHDLVEPLHTIVGLADLLERRHGEALEGSGRELIEHIRGSAERLRGRVDGLLAYARSSQQPLRVQAASVAAATESVVDSLRAPIAEAGAEVVYDPAALPIVVADPALLELVLQNLVSNALKFRRPDAVPRVAVTAEPDELGWRIVVTDNGVGVPPGEHERVFSFFHRLHAVDDAPGTGLGLSLVRRVAERHGGMAGLQDAPGGGTRAWITLPSTRPPAAR